MVSLSKNEFNVIGFLIRNFSKRFTIRNVAAKLKISAPGAHAVLKKLEKSNVVKAERLGTGLFYYVNLENKIARHLAAIVLLDHFDIKKIDTLNLEKESKAAIFDGKRLLIITSSEDSVKDICYKEFKGVDAICKSEDEFVNGLKETEISEILEKGNVLYGEELIVGLIKKVTR